MVIVTYNRKDKLVNVLANIDKQSVAPSVVVIVDNHSTDGTDEILSKWAVKTKIKNIIHRTESNLGGSGGFSKGVELALKQDIDWMYLGDDDAYPNLDLIEKFSNFIKGQGESAKNIASVCATVDSPDGISLFHRRSIKKTFYKVEEIDSTKEDYKKDFFEINLFSFVGVFLNKTMVEKIGLPRSDFFIWYDDSEYSLRINKLGKNLCVPSLVVYHDSPTMEADELSWKTYYGFRNKFETNRLAIGKFRTSIFAKAKLAKFKHQYKKAKKANAENSRNKELLYYVLKDAIYDYKHHKFGISEKYKPGTKLM